MAKIICSLPNASEEINGVAFERHRSGGVISKGHLNADQLASFASIPGYAVDGETAGDVGNAADSDAVATAAGPAAGSDSAHGDSGAGPVGADVPAAPAAAPAAPVVAAAPAPVAAKKPAVKKAAAVKK